MYGVSIPGERYKLHGTTNSFGIDFSEIGRVATSCTGSNTPTGVEYLLFNDFIIPIAQLVAKALIKANIFA